MAHLLLICRSSRGHLQSASLQYDLQHMVVGQLIAFIAIALLHPFQKPQRDIIGGSPDFPRTLPRWCHLQDRLCSKHTTSRQRGPLAWGR